MANYGDELALLWFLGLNALVLAGCWRFARRRMGGWGIQRALDTGLLWYAVQYASVCLPGTVAALRPVTMSGMAGLLAVLLWFAGSQGARAPESQHRHRRAWRLALAVGLFTAGYVVWFPMDQRLLPVMSNDAMTYHFPAAVQWLQTGRLGLFQVWFFNPANTFSPLGGSTFIAWFLAPFGNDVLARFVEVPALLLVGLGIFQLCREMGIELVTAALVSATAVLSRALFFPSIMGKDDLFVLLFFVCALLALTGKGAGGKFGAARAGLALGLLLAMKYSVFISALPLVFAIDGPIRARWKFRQWMTMAAMAAVISGPWYLRNWIIAGNPVFPVRVSIFGFTVFHGLFSMGRSKGLRSLSDSWGVLTGGNYGLPIGVFALLMLGWIIAAVARKPRSIFATLRESPLLRVCLIGAPAGILAFIWWSPFPEVRFVLPSFVLLFVTFGVAIELCVKQVGIRRIIAGGLMFAAVFSAFAEGIRAEAFYLSVVGGGVAIGGTGIGWVLNRGGRRFALPMIGAGMFIVFTFLYINWMAYVENYRTSRIDSAGGWSMRYGSALSLWQFCQRELPADATIAYSNMYLVYPLQGFWLDRRLVYLPTRVGVLSQADLPWLGEHLSGEQVISAATSATVYQPQLNIWLENLRRSAAGYLVVGKVDDGTPPIEVRFADRDPIRFHKLFESDGGIVYKID